MSCDELPDVEPLVYEVLLLLLYPESSRPLSPVEVEDAGFLYAGAELLVVDVLRDTDALLLVVLLVPMPLRTDVVLLGADTLLLLLPVVVFLNEEPSVWALKP